MRNRNMIACNAGGFALVTVMFAMMIMMFLGVASMILSSTEIEIASVEKIYKGTFYNADGGTNLAAEILEQNMNCAVGFTGNTNANVDSLIAGTVYVEGGSEASNNVPDGFGSRNFAYNILVATPSDANRDFSFPVTYDPVFNPGGYHPVSNPKALHTNVTVGGDTVYGEGGRN